jgi:hypothetical protein
MSAVVTAGCLAVLLLAFIAMFLLPGILHWFRLRKVLRVLREARPGNRDQVRAAFVEDKRLSHLWKEYGDSLHDQCEEVDGKLVVRAVRATVPSELHFNSQFVVDGRLRTEFFKHLPGIFTGIGIIGTFSGLIGGLRAFQVSDNPATVRASLESLMRSVGEAFLISAAAIGAAMLVTLIEKLLLSALYQQAEEIAHEIDAKFDSGAGEEYLSSLVKTSTESLSQSKILKDALVKELGVLLRELTEAQINATREQNERVVESAREDNRTLGATIADSIQNSLKGPLEDITATVKSASGDQSASASRMLQDVMTSFSQRLNDLFGGQISGLTELNQQTAQSIRDAVGTLQALVANMEATSQRSADAMAQRMAEAVEKMEARQASMQEQSEAFILQLRELVAASQSDTNRKLQATLETIGSEVSNMLATLAKSQERVFEENRTRETAMTDRATAAVDGLSGSVEAVLKELGAATTKMADSVATLSQATSSSVEKMNTGADLLGSASRSFASAGERVGTIMGQVSIVAAKLAETSGGLTTGASAMQEVLRDYGEHRDSIGRLVAEMAQIVEQARREASLTNDILSRLEGSATRLGTAQKQADEYLDGVSRVLGEAHESFSKEVVRTLDKANSEFHSKLTLAVGMLKSAVDELEVTLTSMGNLAPVRA